MGRLSASKISKKSFDSFVSACYTIYIAMVLYVMEMDDANFRKIEGCERIRVLAYSSESSNAVFGYMFEHGEKWDCLTQKEAG